MLKKYPALPIDATFNAKNNFHPNVDEVSKTLL